MFIIQYTTHTVHMSNVMWAASSCDYPFTLRNQPPDFFSLLPPRNAAPLYPLWQGNQFRPGDTLRTDNFGSALCTEWSELSLLSTLEGQGPPLYIGKQGAGTYSRLYQEYVDPWSAGISMSSWHQCLLEKRPFALPNSRPALCTLVHWFILWWHSCCTRCKE
jgi:hypothetical protein